MKLVEHIPGVSRIYKNALGCATKIVRKENKVFKPIESSIRCKRNNSKYCYIPKKNFINIGKDGYRSVVESYIDVTKSFKGDITGRLPHGVHAPKVGYGKTTIKGIFLECLSKMPGIKNIINITHPIIKTFI